jgi:phage shock protein A
MSDEANLYTLPPEAVARIEQLETAWERDQSVIEEQRQEIGRLKSKINQLQQKLRER